MEPELDVVYKIKDSHWDDLEEGTGVTVCTVDKRDGTSLFFSLSFGQRYKNEHTQYGQMLLPIKNKIQKKEDPHTFVDLMNIFVSPVYSPPGVSWGKSRQPFISPWLFGVPCFKDFVMTPNFKGDERTLDPSFYKRIDAALLERMLMLNSQMNFWVEKGLCLDKLLHGYNCGIKEALESVTESCLSNPTVSRSIEKMGGWKKFLYVLGFNGKFYGTLNKLEKKEIVSFCDKYEYTKDEKANLCSVYSPIYLGFK